MAILVIGGILAAAGIAGVIYGNNLNHSLASQFQSLLSSGSTNPGTIWIVLGVVAIVLGVGLVVYYFLKNR